EQYGMMLGGLGETLPVRVFALEPSLLLVLEHPAALELPLRHPDLRRQWLQAYARGLRRRYFEAPADRAPNVLATFHESPATQHLAQALVRRLRGLGEEIGVLSDTDVWRSLEGLRFRSLTEGDRTMDATEARKQIAEWHDARRIVIDVTAA